MSSTDDALRPKWVAGMDGCTGGWIIVFVDANGIEGSHARFASTVAEALDCTETPAVVAIDMPIGLPERSGPKGRTPERLVRPLLGNRQSSVFSIPSRAAVYAGIDETVPESDRFRHACAIARATSAENRAVAKQGFCIFPKVASIDLLLRSRSDLIPRVYECHPEVSFWAMNARKPIAQPKKIKNRPWPSGLDLRRQLLLAQGLSADLITPEIARRHRVGLDDLIDACAAAWTAARIARGEAISFPDPPERDGCGLPIAIWA